MEWWKLNEAACGFIAEESSACVRITDDVMGFCDAWHNMMSLSWCVLSWVTGTFTVCVCLPSSAHWVQHLVTVTSARYTVHNVPCLMQTYCTM